ncbi:hypothetical protein [Actinoallomurus sp. NPDC050550]
MIYAPNIEYTLNGFEVLCGWIAVPKRVADQSNRPRSAVDVIVQRRFS